MSDLIAPGMIAGLALGRIGCLLNGCCYGGESTAPWAVSFPRESAVATASAPAPLSPPYIDQASSGRFYGFRLGAKSHGRRAVVTQVDAESPAEAAGLVAGDVIDAINGEAVADLDAAQRSVFQSQLSGRSLAIHTVAGERRVVAAVEPPPRTRRVHPTQLYSAIDAALLCWVLWSFYPFRRRDGEVTALMITLHPISRFLLEMIRVDEPAVFGTRLSISQNLSIVLLAVGIGMWLWLRTQPKGNLAFFDGRV